MRRLTAAAFVAAAALATCWPIQAQNRSEDEYTRYELLAPETSSFKIIYDVTAVTPGATFFFNPIREGSVATDESVIDLMTGSPLKFQEVSGAEARESGLANAGLDGRYIRVELARPVPPGGEGRIRIIKTYKDAKSYYRDGSAIVFDRPLGIKRNAVVLPPGFELSRVQHSFAGDRRTGRTRRHQLHEHLPWAGTARAAGQGAREAAPARPAPAAAGSARAATPGDPSPAPSTGSGQAMERVRVSERAFQDREIVYFLKGPETHAFSLYHDYTETREGTDKYVNVVRAGSTVSEPSAKILDTGEALKVETLKGRGDHRGRHRYRRGRAARVRGSRDPLSAGQEGAERAAADRGNLHRSRALRSHRRAVDVAAQLRRVRATDGACRRAGIDGELDSRHHHPDGRRSRPARVRQSETRRHRRVREGTTKIMLKGTRVALIKKIQPVSIARSDFARRVLRRSRDPQGQVSLARLGARSDAPAPRTW